MRILVAPDKFKGSLGAASVATQLAAGLGSSFPQAKIDPCPLADGGEGTAEILCAALGGEWIVAPAHDALGRAITARFAWVEEPAQSILDLTDVAGVARLAPTERNPLRASSTGLGELLRHANAWGPVTVCLGGSATNDGGLGMARALGFALTDAEGQPILHSEDLSRLRRIVKPTVGKGLLEGHGCIPIRGCPIVGVTVAADVQNPLLGPNGATRVFGAQKGATAEQIELLERGLARLAEVVAAEFGKDYRDLPGAGAAGGLGFGLAAFCRATLRSGFAVVAEAIGLEARVRKADLVVTGEGRLDNQSLGGKVPVEVARLARRLGKPCYAIVGEAEKSEALEELFDGIVVLGNSAGSADTAPLLRARAAELGLLLRR